MTPSTRFAPRRLHARIAAVPESSPTAGEIAVYRVALVERTFDEITPGVVAASSTERGREFHAAGPPGLAIGDVVSIDRRGNRWWMSDAFATQSAIGKRFLLNAAFVTSAADQVFRIGKDGGAAEGFRFDSNDQVTGVARGNDGSLYLGVRDDSAEFDYSVVKLDGFDGSVVWNTGVSAGDSSVAMGGQVEFRNGVLVCGSHGSNLGLAGRTNTIARLDPSDGSILWSNAIAGDSAFFREFDQVVRAIDSNGRAFVARVKSGATSILDVYGPDGSLAGSLSAPSGGGAVLDVCVDSSDNVYAVGITGFSLPSYWLRRYDSSLSLRWESTFTDVPDFQFSHGLAVNPAGRLFTFLGRGTGPIADRYVAEFDPASGAFLAASSSTLEPENVFQDMVATNDRIVTAAKTTPSGTNSNHGFDLNLDLVFHYSLPERGQRFGRQVVAVP